MKDKQERKTLLNDSTLVKDKNTAYVNLITLLYAIYANPEHAHFIISRSPKLSEEYLSTIIAESSERFINGNKLCVGHFAWQESAAAFSVSAEASLWEKTDVNKVCKYILNQPKHHNKVTFAEEYELFMKFYQMTLRITINSDKPIKYL